MISLLEMFYLGGVTAGIGPAFGARGQVVLQLCMTLGWPIVGLGCLLRLVVFRFGNVR